MYKTDYWLALGVEVVGSSPIKGPRCFIEQKLYPYCLVLVGSRNGFERDFSRTNIHWGPCGRFT